jgi:hypothetical protein
MHQLLLERLKDERSRRIIFVSHCLLNENTRYQSSPSPSRPVVGLL